MAETNQNLVIYQNANEAITIAITDDNGNPMDLKLYSDLCWVLTLSGKEILRYDINDSELVIANADAVDDGLRVLLSPAITGALKERVYVHQAWGTYGDNARPLCIGYATVLRGDGC